jgi:chromosome segregation and condensation protein ScpB
MSSELAPTLARIDAIAGKVEELVNQIVELRDHLEESGIVLPHMAGYRLATVLSRIDHAAAEIVMQQARRMEADGQVAAFPDLEA